MTLVDTENYMVVEYNRFKLLTVYMCDTCFIARFLCRIQIFGVIEPYLNYFQQHGAGEHCRLHHGGEHQVQICENL